jgi:NAD(P)-dependent dehydrogenase (short-subunit alcohol dehydrogenase family)
MTNQQQRVALITGASRGLGLEIARLYARNGFGLVLTARGEEALREAADEIGRQTDLVAVPGDVADPSHAEELVRRGTERFGRIDVLLNNASELGPSPMPELAAYPLDELARVFAVNAIAPLHLIQLVLPQMKQREQGVIINVTSDAGVEAYPSWGGYGASKAALEHLSRVLAAELEGSGVRVYVVDPGDMNTRMHQEAEPGVDLSDLPTPDVPAPAFLHLVERESAPFGRFQAQELIRPEAAHA